MRNSILALFLGTAVLAAPAAQAGPYDALYVFGDSLSDRGNLAETGALQLRAGLPIRNYPNPPSFHDSFTNGDVAVQVLARSLGLNADPSLWVTGFRDVNNLFGGSSYVPGTNYAVAGSTAAAQAQGGAPIINLPQQVGAYLLHSGGAADPNALYTVFTGGNDVRYATLQGTGPAAVLAGVQAELGSVAALRAAGARNFLVVNVPNVGDIPEMRQDNPSLAGTATALSQQYDALLAQGLAGQPFAAGADLSSFDLFSYNE
ncbi:MAG TPA: SGNH/GDSL hydrolase family protein, partial [Acetobacteraceae bacterium]